MRPALLGIAQRMRHNCSLTSQLHGQALGLHHVRRGGRRCRVGSRRRSDAGEDGRRCTGVDVDVLQTQPVVLVAWAADVTTSATSTPQPLPTHVSRNQPRNYTKNTLRRVSVIIILSRTPDHFSQTHLYYTAWSHEYI